jgi:hypothetical protein
MANINIATFRTLFINEIDLKNLTMIRDDVDMGVLQPTITICQDSYLLKLLGSQLFYDLQNKIATVTLNQDEILLMQSQIVPCLAWAVMKEAPIFLSYKYSNKGVQTMDGLNSKPAPISELSYLRDMANSHYQLYAQRLTQYLIANTFLFPAYRTMLNYNDIAPATSGWNTRIALGNRPRKDWLEQSAGGSNITNLTSAMIAYFNVSKIVTAFSHTATTANFSGSFLPAPNGLPATTGTNFTFYDNSTLIPTAAVVQFQDNGNGTCTLTVNASILGFNFQVGDVINSSGKYQ